MATDVSSELEKQGWFLSPEGLQLCIEEKKTSTPYADAIIKAALDLDLKEIGAKHLPDVAVKKNENIQGPVVLQIQKLKNVAAPKDNQESQGAPQLMRLTLTDGHVTFPALEMEKINKLTPNTPPGVKLRLSGTVQISTGFILLNKRNCEILGGRVEKLYENWALKKSLANQTRYNIDSGGSGPPPFIPFGQRGKTDSRNTLGSKKDEFKSLEQKTKEPSKKEEDNEFLEQRKVTIKAAIETKEEGRGKSFGVSSINKPNDSDVAKIVEMGFTIDQAVAALKHNGNSLQNAVSALLRETEATDSTNRDRRAPKTRSNGRERNEREIDRSDQASDRSEKGRRGRYNKDAGDEEDDYRKAPSSSTTIFDFLQPSFKEKLPEGPPKVRASRERSSSSNHDSEGKTPNPVPEPVMEKRGAGNSGGPPNLPPRLAKQREEERIRRLSGGGRSSSASSPGLPHQSAQPLTHGIPPPSYNTVHHNPGNRPPLRGPPMMGPGPRFDPSMLRGAGGQMRPPFRHGFPGRQLGMRMDYAHSKRGYDPRGPVPAGRGMWMEGGRGGYRNFDPRYGDRDYNMPQGQRRGPNPRYDSRYYQNYPCRPNRDHGYQYQDRRSLNAPPNHPYGLPKHFGAEEDPPRESFEGKPNVSRHEASDHAHEDERSESGASEEQNKVIDGDSGGGSQESESSDGIEVEVGQPNPVSTAQGYAPASVEQATQPESMNETTEQQYAEQPVVMSSVDQSASAVPTYVYSDGSAGPVSGGYVQAGPPGATPSLIPHMQSLSLQPGVSAAQLHAYPAASYAMTVDGQVYVSQMYSPHPVSSMEYVTSSSGMSVMSSSANMVNGNKQKNPADVVKHSSWKAGDHCMAKFWEDQQFYRAIIQDVDPSGTTCTVLFPDYGNTEQVAFTDVQSVTKQTWDMNIQSPTNAMPMGASLVSVAQAPVPLAPPGIIIQNPPPAMSFMSTYQDPNAAAYQGSMVGYQPSTQAYPMAMAPHSVAYVSGKQSVPQHPQHPHHVYMATMSPNQMHPHAQIAQIIMTSQPQQFMGTHTQMIPQQQLNKKG